MKQVVMVFVLLVWVVGFSPGAVGERTAESVETGVTVVLERVSGGDGHEPATSYQYRIVARNVSHDVGAYDLTVSTSNGTVATLQSIEPVERTDSFTSITFSVDDTSVRMMTANANLATTDGVVTLGTVTISTNELGTTDLRVDVSELTDTTGAGYTILSTAATTVAVEALDSIPPLPGSDEPPKNTDDDPLLEDIDGDGDDGDLFDALAYYNNRDSNVIRNNPDLFDFDGDGTSGDLFDALALYNEIS